MTQRIHRLALVGGALIPGAEFGDGLDPGLGRIPAGLRWRLSPDEVVEVLTPSLAELWDPELRREHLFTSARWPEGLLVDGIPVGDRVLWGMTLRLLDDLVPRLLAGEWEDALR